MGAGCSSSSGVVAPMKSTSYVLPAPVKADAIRLGAGVDIVTSGGAYHEAVPVAKLSRALVLAHYQPPEFPPIPVIGPKTHELIAETWALISKREYDDLEVPGRRVKGGIYYYQQFFKGLFALSTEFRVSFPSVHLQAGVMAKVISTCLKVKYDELDDVAKKIQHIGRIHQPIVDSPYLYAMYAVNLHRTVSLCLLPHEATPARMTAWLHVLAFVLLHMLPHAISDHHIRIYSGQTAFPTAGTSTATHNLAATGRDASTNGKPKTASGPATANGHTLGAPVRRTSTTSSSHSAPPSVPAAAAAPAPALTIPGTVNGSHAAATAGSTESPAAATLAAPGSTGGHAGHHTHFFAHSNTQSSLLSTSSTASATVGAPGGASSAVTAAAPAAAAGPVQDHASTHPPAPLSLRAADHKQNLSWSPARPQHPNASAIAHSAAASTPLNGSTAVVAPAVPASASVSPATNPAAGLSITVPHF